MGVSPFGCQALPFTPASTPASEDDPWHPDGLELPCDVTYFLTVRATNAAGLSVANASARSKLCCTPPVNGGARQRIKLSTRVDSGTS